MPAAAGIAVGNWLLGMGATMAAATTIGAITTAAVTGALIGGTIGAVTAVATGGDIIKGTLKGALIGGVVGGAASYLSGAATAAGKAAQTSWEAGQAASAAAEATALTGTPEVLSGGRGLLYEGTGGLGTEGVIPPPAGSTFAPTVPAGTPVAPGAASVVPKVSPLPPAESSAAQVTRIMEESRKGQIYAGIGTGLATSAGTVLAGKDKAESDKELLEAQRAQEEAKKAGNLAGDYQALLREFTLPESWITSTENLYDKYRIKSTPVTKRGLLAGGMA